MNDFEFEDPFSGEAQPRMSAGWHTDSAAPHR